MSQSQRSAVRVRVPEPQAITRVVSRWGARVAAYMRDPEHQMMWGIILLATLLRLVYLDLIPFRGFHAAQLALSDQFLRRPSSVTVGLPSLGGVPNPPLTTYLLALPVLIGRDPRVAAGMTILLNVAAVAGLYLLARPHYGVRVARLAGLLLAVCPWAILLSRQPVPEALVIPWVVLLLWGLLRGLVESRPWGWTLTWVALGLLGITSLPTLVLAPVVLLLMVLYRRRVSWLHALLGLGIALIIALPYLYYLNLHRLADLRQLALGLLRRAYRPHDALGTLRVAAWLHAGRWLNALAGVSVAEYRPGPAILYRLIQLAMLIFLLALPTTIALSIHAWSHWRERVESSKYVLLMLWLWLPILALPLQPLWTELPFLAALLPVGFIAMALVIDRALAIPESPSFKQLWWSPFLRLAMWFVVLAMLGWQGYAVLYLDQFVGRQDTTGGYGVPYRYWRRTARLLEREVRETRTDVIWAMAEGARVPAAETEQIVSYLVAPWPRTVWMGRNGEECMLLPAGRPAVYLLMRPAPLIDGMITQLNGEEKGLVYFPEDMLEARVLTVASHPVEEMLALIPKRGLWALDAGPRLLGYAWPADARSGGEATLTTYWTFLKVPARERGLTHDLWAELQTIDGAPVARGNGWGLPEASWDEGLLLLQWSRVPLPAALPEGDYPLLVGLYRTGDYTRNRQIDNLGRDLGDAIVLDAVHVAAP